MTEAEHLPGSGSRSSHWAAQIPQEDENRAASVPNKETKYIYGLKWGSRALSFTQELQLYLYSQQKKKTEHVTMMARTQGLKLLCP